MRAMFDKTSKMIPTEVSFSDLPPHLQKLSLERHLRMTPTEFCYWLQGYFELTDEKEMDESKVDSVKRHLSLVFAHSIDPKAGGPEQQAKLNAIHNPGESRPRC
jgi:hypothetical protein